MTFAAFQAIGEKERDAALCRRRHPAVIVPVEITIECGVRGHEHPLERGDRPDDVRQRDRRRFAWKRGAKALVVGAIDDESFEHLGFVSLQAHFDGVLVVHRHLHLRFEAPPAIVPSERRVIDDVGQRHARTGMCAARGAYGARQPVGERQRLLVAARARKRAVARQLRIVEQEAAELDFGFGERVVNRNLGYRKPSRHTARKKFRRRGLRGGGP